MVKNEFFLNNSKNIDIWILNKEQNLFRSEFYMCVPNLVKTDWELMEWFGNNYSGLHYEELVRYDTWCIGRSLCDKSTKLVQMIITIYMYIVKA